MSTLILILFLALLACMVLGGVAVTAVLLIHLVRWARRTDPYEPAAAEAPPHAPPTELTNRFDPAWQDVQRVFAGQFDDDGDLLPQGAPRVAAASDLDGSGLMFEVYEAIDRYRLGEPIEQDAPREV